MTEFVLIFGDVETKASETKRRQANKKRLRMQTLYGAGPEGRTCGECVHLVTRSRARDYFKCLHYGITGGPGTDWRKRWPACGKFEQTA